MHLGQNFPLRFGQTGLRFGPAVCGAASGSHLLDFGVEEVTECDLGANAAMVAGAGRSISLNATSANASIVM